MKLNFYLTLIISLFYGAAVAQNSEITGTVTDETGETFPTVQVFLDNNITPVRSDMDGKFKIGNIPSGNHTVTFKFPEYKTKTSNVVIQPGKNLVLNMAMELAVELIEEFSVTAKISREGNTSAEKEKQNASTVTDNTTAEDMKKRPDSRAIDAMKRISGASIQDNKFIVIRGLNDRYNAAYINGAPLPSSESDKKAFSFDIFPSMMLDNIVINKTATPDLPGEFAGGVININTKNPKDSNFQVISLGTSYNTLTTFKNFKTYDGGKLDWLGLDNGARGLSSEVPGTKDFSSLSAAEKARLAKNVTPSWAINNRTALPALNLQYGLGRNIKLNEKRSLGVIFAYTYQNNFNTNRNIRREFEEQSMGVVQKSELVDSVYSQTILNSGLLNFSYEINERNKLKFKNMMSINSDDRVNIRKGVREMDSDPHQFERSSNRWFTQNVLFTSQLDGTHEISKSKMKFNWNLGMSDVNRTVPNMRRVVYQKTALDEADTNSQYIAVIQNNGTIPTAAGNMFWSETKEKIYSAKYDLVIPFDTKNVKTEFKVGGMQQFRARDFNARNLGFSRYKASGIEFDNSVLLLPEDQIFSAEHLGLMANGKGGFKLEEATKVSDSYSASSMLHAGFLMFDTKIKDKFRFVGGARLESYNQKFSYTESGSNIDRTIDTTVIDILPSLNFIYSINKKMNIRLSYYKTLSRPEFRELAPFAFYNFAQDNILSGNPALKRALIDNADVRYEIFPGAGQVFTVSGFYKYFKNPIELVNRTGTSGAAELYYTNVSKVVNYGLELEYRIKLETLTKQGTKENRFLSNTTLYTNLALINSKVDVSNIIGSAASSRPLQGQSPYIVNAGIQYTDPRTNLTVSASYNVIGRRIYIVGNVQEPDVWENHRNVIDLQVSKSFLDKKLEVKLNVRDLLAQDQILYQDLNKNRKYDAGTDNRWQETTFGQTVSLSLSYTF